MLATARDVPGLRRCGIMVDFSAGQRKAMKVDSPEVALEDHKFKQYWNLVFSLMRSRSASMLRHIWGVPELLAGLHHKDERLRKHTFAKFQKIVEAYNTAKGRGEQIIVDMTKRSPLGTTAMRWATIFAEAGKFETITTQMQELLDAIWKSLNQTIIIENANKELRDKETRSSVSKAYCKYDKWAAPIDAKLFASFQRIEIGVKGCAPVPAAFEPEALFNPPHGNDAKLDSVNLLGITGKQTWETCNTASILESCMDTMLMCHALDNNCWQELSCSWRSFFIPEGQILTNKDRQPSRNVV